MRPDLLILITLIISSCTSKNMTTSKPSFHNNKVIAHRGAWKTIQTSENSVASLKEAIRLGCYGSETDIHLTADSALVVNHDPTRNGLHIQKSTLEELRKTPLSNGEPIPVLDDFLKIIKKQTGTRLIVELKASQRGVEWADATVRKVINTVHDLNAEPWVTYISFDYHMCQELLRLNPDADVQYLNGDKSPEELKAAGIRGTDYHYSVYQKHPEWIQQAKDLGIDLNVWTVNEADLMDWFLERNFDFITTNEPELLFRQAARIGGKNIPVK